MEAEISNSVLPAVLLAPKYECRGVAASSPLDLGQTFDVSTVKGAQGFTICARICGSAEQRILSKGTAPSGWAFTAPSKGGLVAFLAGEREKKEVEEASAPAEEAPAEPVPADRRPSKVDPPPRKNSKRGSAIQVPVPEPEAAAPLPCADVGATRVDDGQWHHVAIVFRAGRINAYVDGRHDGDIGMEVCAAPSAALLMGPDPGEGGDAKPPEGLKDVQVYSSALSDDQILGLATESRALPSGISLPLTPWQVKDFWQLGSEKQSTAARAMVSESLGLGKDPKKEFQDEVICDFFISLLEYAQSICLTPRKTAVFVAIMQSIFTAMFRRSKTSACVGEPFSSSECFLQYKQLVLNHAATAAAALSEVPSKRLQIFSTGEVKFLTEFVSGTLFQHFFLYQCVIVNPQDTAISYASVTLEGPRGPPLLRKGKLLPPKQDTLSASALRKPRGETDGQSNSGTDASVTAEGTLGVLMGAEGGGEVGEDTAADATQMAGRMPTGGEDELDFLCSEAHKAVEQHLEASILARDAALFNK